MSVKRKQATINHKSNFIKVFFNRHRYATLLGFNHLLRTPFSNFLTIMVIGVALALPISLMVILHNAQAVSQHWDIGSRVSLFLKHDVSESQVQQLIEKLQTNPDIATAHYISPKEGLYEFEKRAGLDNMLNQLPENPIPAVIEIDPIKNLQAPEKLQQLVVQLKKLPEVDSLQIDMAWVKRLFAILALVKQAIYALGLLLALAVLLIIGNTIRLIVQNYHQEIEVIKLVGGTDHFIRRPFLYMGMLYGFGGGLIAWCLVGLFLWSLQTPLQHLMQLYASQFVFIGLNLTNLVMILVISIALGLFGAWFAVARQIQKIEPQ